MTISASGAFAPQTYVPAAFVENLYKRFVQFDDDQTDCGSYLEDIRDAAEKYQGAPPFSHDNQQKLSILYDNFMNTARTSALFIAFCLKNLAFMEKAIRPIEGRLNRELAFRAIVYSQRDHLEREIEHFREALFEGIGLIQPLLTPQTIRRRESRPFRGDPFVAEFLSGRALHQQDFNDWLEFNFFRAHRLPLNLYRRTEPVNDYLLTQIMTDAYARRMVVRVLTGKMQESFPGLSLDGIPKHEAQFDYIRRHIVDHASFRPATTARVIQFRTPPSKGVGRFAPGS